MRQMRTGLFSTAIQTALRLTMLATLAIMPLASARAEIAATTRPAAVVKPVYIQPQDIDSATILPGPPAEDSPEHRAEVATLLQWQEKRTSADVARCQSEEQVTVFVFSDVLGDGFNAKSLPITAALMNQAYVDARIASNAAKQKWKRVRPPLALPQIQPCVVLEKTPSYPSGHATRGVMWALLLAEIYPAQKEALLARGRLIGQDRVIAGMHYRSDVEAGQTLGVEIVKRLLANPDFRSSFQRAKDECLSAAH